MNHLTEEVIQVNMYGIGLAKPIDEARESSMQKESDSMPSEEPYS